MSDLNKFIFKETLFKLSIFTLLLFLISKVSISNPGKFLSNGELYFVVKSLSLLEICYHES
ncbi:MAG: hypothetical protein CM15mP104_0290 [Gammaproteobacteria bacterium]|nr:MAG: hypothetical protein CM15mP104_0290 [Gammaproteobacteria bacterium]